jgi:pantothenate kinase type III
MNKKYVCTFDYGNTKEKGALYLNDEMQTHFVIKDFSQVVQKYNLNIKNCQIIECSVKSSNRVKTNIPSQNVKEFFKGSKFFDMKVNYTETLGMDRLVQAYYLYSQDHTPKIVIDAGTFTTLDLISENGFDGGYILPGFEILKKTYQAGDLLKPHDIHEDLFEDIPHNTPDAISQGLFFSFITPIKNIIQNSALKKVILTGGNAEYIKNTLEQDPNFKNFELIVKEELIHESLMYIAKRMTLS